MSKGINPDEAVMYGAAVQGGILSEEKGTEDIVLVNVLLQVQASTLCHTQAPPPPQHSFSQYDSSINTLSYIGTPAPAMQFLSAQFRLL